MNDGDKGKRPPLTKKQAEAMADAILRKHQKSRKLSSKTRQRIEYGMAALMYAGAIHSYVRLRTWEHTGGPIRMHWLEAALYHLGGKWLVSALIAAVATLLLRSGLKKAGGDD